MTTVLLIRHGESTSNIRGFYAGQRDVALTEKGQKQAEKIAEFLKNEPIEALVASPLSRALATAEPIAAGHQLTVQPEKAFIEMDVGDWSGKAGDDITHEFPDLCRQLKESPADFRFPGGESFYDIEARAVPALLSLVRSHSGQTVCIITHGGVIRSLERYFTHVPMEKLGTIPYVGNASVSRLQFDGEEATMIYRGKNDFLADIATYMAKVV